MIRKQDLISEKNNFKPEETYSIGLLSGNSPFNLTNHKSINNPIISRSDFVDNDVNFVADPFAIFDSGIWYLFYESIGFNSRNGNICVSTSKDLITWSQPKIVLEERFHLSYPHIFRYNGEYLMLPETHEAGEIRLYVAEEFPYKWKFKKTILPLCSVDSTLYFSDNLFWLFTCDTPHRHNRTRLYFSEDLYGDWIEHPQSPIYEHNSQDSRPGGSIFKYNGKTYRVAQNCKPFYGHSVNVYEIEKMTKTHFYEKKMDAPLLKGSGISWNAISMHHIDLHKLSEDNWIAFVDGRRN